MNKLNCFIVMWNRLTYPMKMAEYLSDHNVNVIMIDNNSSYEPLLEWYKSKCKYKVYRLKENMGHKCLYISGILNEYKDDHYFLTDPDLDLSQVPADFIDVLFKGLEHNKSVLKSGLSLEINDLPDNEYARGVFKWEEKFWNPGRFKNGFYESDTDTTFALYDRKREWEGFMTNLNEPENLNKFFCAVRSPRPYTVRHLPWYNTPDNLTEEEKYYLKITGTYWMGQYKKTFGVE